MTQHDAGVLRPFYRTDQFPSRKEGGSGSACPSSPRSPTDNGAMGIQTASAARACFRIELALAGAPAVAVME